MDNKPLEVDEEQTPIIHQQNKIIPKQSLTEIKDDKKKTKTATFKDIFYFATKKDKIIMLIAALFSLGQGFLLPALSLLFGDITNDFAPSENEQEDLLDLVFENVKDTSIKLILVGVGVFFASLIANILWLIASSNQVRILKKEYFNRLISQNCTWYDKKNIETLSTEFVTHTDAFEEIMSNKLHIFFMSLGIILGGFVIGFIKGWLFTMCVIGVVFFGKNVMQSFKVQSEAYKEAGAISDQVLTFIKTVKSFNGEEHEYQKYQRACKKAEKGVLKFAKKAALCFGFFMFTIFFMYGLAFIIGSRLIAEEVINHNFNRDYNIGDILTIFFAVITGPVLKSIEAGKLAMTSVFEIIGSDSQEQSGMLKNDIKGEIEFKNVSFAYPSKPDHLVLKNVSFKVVPGQKAAIVGPSGCGKSTCVQLLQRYYEPTSGSITLDGIELKEYDLQFLRSELGLVSQQPVLFADTIRNNILLGADDKNKITDEQINAALQQAQALEFVQGFDKGLEEFVGSMGGQLSGGQKQRIAIARSLVKNPKIFLFDEATSALDRKNEKEIQNTIDQIVDQFTSITIAHRLNTIQNSDQIIVLKDGKVIENGNHNELVNKENGFYKNLVKNQIVNLQQQENLDEPLEQDDVISKQDLQIEQSSISKIESTILYDKKKKKKKKKSSLTRYLGSEKKLLIPGAIIAALHGSILPLLGFLLAKVLGVLQKFAILTAPDFDESVYGYDKDDLLWESDKYSIGLIGLSVGIFIFNFLQYYIFQKIGQIFTTRLRAIYFRRLLYKDLVYFDQRGNEPGNLSSRLSSDCNTINILVSTYIGSIFQSLSSFLTGIIIAFFASWRISLVTLALSPLLIFAGLIESALWAGTQNQKKLNTSKLSETVNNIKIIKSLTAEKNIRNSYDIMTNKTVKSKMKKGFIASLFLSLSQMAQFVVYGIVFLVGAVFVRDNGLSFTNLMIATFSILFGAYGAGMANQQAGDIGKAQSSSKKILKELDEISKIEYDPKNPQYNPTGQQRQKPELTGEIEFKQVYFRYTGRKNWVLKNVNFKIDVGNSYALVGGSGSGKSTIFQLIQRFYDIQKGQILFNGNDIKTLDLVHLRSLFGVVNQEPFLFNGDIEYNIKYNDDSITEQIMIEAAKNSNSYDFIQENEDGFKRNVGNRGEHLSGGQKQRVNIARCLARNSKVLLFDEATSALDSLSEQQVQEAIEKVSQNRTSMTIAHRISTIKNCNKIFVFEDGIIMERGDYQQLINEQGIFYDLANN